MDIVRTLIGVHGFEVHHVADHLEVVDRLVELDALVRVLEGVGHGLLRVAHVGGRHGNAFELEVIGDDLPAVTRLSQQNQPHRFTG